MGKAGEPRALSLDRTTPLDQGFSGCTRHGGGGLHLAALLAAPLLPAADAMPRPEPRGSVKMALSAKMAARMLMLLKLIIRMLISMMMLFT